MRVLCLHSEASSALQFSQNFHQLEERLWEKHGIELVFVDGPLLDVQNDGAVGEEGGAPKSAADGPGSSSERVSRRWYVEEEATARRTIQSEASTPGAASLQPSGTSFSGLDASLLHLSQIWTRGGANISTNLGECLPFQGVMGIGQGANVAGLLPLLSLNDCDDEDYGDEKENVDGGNLTRGKPVMFQGLRFVVLIDGEEILSQRGDEGQEEEAENDVYVGPEGIQSLHVITDDGGDSHASAATRKRSSGEKLARLYGPNAQVHRSRKQHDQPCTPSTSNAIGKFLVGQKKKLRSNSKSMKLLALQNQLATVEQLAAVTIAQEVQKNPPKALMAVIGPAPVTTSRGAADPERDRATEEEGEWAREDGEAEGAGDGEGCVKVEKAVAGWQGARRRGFGEEGGGAPCPGEFLLREEDR